MATLDGYGPAADEQPATDGSLTLRLAADDVPIEGRVLDRDGRPVAGATVRVWSLWWTDEGDLGPWLEAIERADAAFPFHIDIFVKLGWAGTGVGPDAGDDRARRPVPPRRDRPRAGRRALDRGAGDRDDRPLRRTRPARRSASGRSIPGRRRKNARPRSTDRRSSISSVRHGPSSASSATPRAGRRSPGRSSRTRSASPTQSSNVEAITDAEGRYRLTGIPPDREFNDRSIGVAVLPPEGEPYLSAYPEVAWGESPDPVTVDVAMRRGAWITGRVVDASTGEGVGADVTYFTFEDNPHLDNDGRVSWDTSQPTDPDGRFRLLGIPGPGVVCPSGNGSDIVSASGPTP